MRSPGREPPVRYRLSWAQSRLWCMMAFMVMAVVMPGADAAAQQVDFTTDFEDGTLRGWTAEGAAFRHQPTLGDNPTARNRGQAAHLQGRYWIGTYERYQGRPGQKAGEVQGDRPTGTLTSALFTIPKGTMSFLVGGGGSFETRVELLIDDPLEGNIRVLHATGNNTETMQRQSWDLAPYTGKRGRLRIVDASSGAWGHINADDFRFLPRAEGASRPSAPPSDRLGRRTMVPDVIGLSVEEAAAAIRRERLAVEKGGTLSSRRAKGTVVKQSPGTGTAVPVGSTIRIWVSQGVELPALQVVIVPESHEVTQGEEAVFTSRLSSAAGRIVREDWTGPGSRSGSGSRFTVSTEELPPGTYPITLLVMDTTERSARRAATLIVRARPAVRYHLEASVMPDTIYEGEAVRLTAALDRAVSDAEYGFDFGDGSPPGHGRRPEARHMYAAAGEFHAVVSVRLGGRVIAQSGKIKVTVKRKLQALMVFLRADRERAETGGEVVFQAEADRQVPGMRYRFVFGDSTVSEWGEAPQTGHVYKRQGVYAAVVQLKAAGEEMRESAPFTVTVRDRPGPAYTVQIQSDRKRIRPDGEIQFAAVLQPPDQAARYAFNFGDRKTSAWLPVGQAAHRYAEPGDYAATVAVRKEGVLIAESEPIPIIVTTPPHDISAEKTVPDDLPTAVTALLAFSAGFFLRSRQGKRKSGENEPVLSFKASLHQDPGEQLIGAVQRLDLEYALHLRCVADPGRQEVIADDSPALAEPARGGEWWVI